MVLPVDPLGLPCPAVDNRTLSSRLGIKDVLRYDDISVSFVCFSFFSLPYVLSMNVSRRQKHSMGGKQFLVDSVLPVQRSTSADKAWSTVVSPQSRRVRDTAKTGGQKLRAPSITSRRPAHFNAKPGAALTSPSGRPLICYGAVVESHEEARACGFLAPVLPTCLLTLASRSRPRDPRCLFVQTQEPDVGFSVVCCGEAPEAPVGNSSNGIAATTVRAKSGDCLRHLRTTHYWRACRWLL